MLAIKLIINSLRVIISKGSIESLEHHVDLLEELSVTDPKQASSLASSNLSAINRGIIRRSPYPNILEIIDKSPELWYAINSDNDQWVIRMLEIRSRLQKLSNL